MQAAGSTSAMDFLEARRQFDALLKAGNGWSGNERDCVYLNTGGAVAAAAGDLGGDSEGGQTIRFANISAVAGLDYPDDGRAAATVDWDHDGDLDLWISNRTGPQLRFVRNDFPKSGETSRFVAIRLAGDGETVSRDAVGARVEVYLPGASVPLIQTLRAGDGYLSQSSKWLHFGLGDAATVERVVVRWPGAMDVAEEFAGVEPGGWYALALGAGEARAWEPPARSVRLKPSKLAAPPEPGSARTFFSKRVPAPVGEFEDFEGNTRSLADFAGRPLLVNLWASWCAPCAAELKDLADHRQQLHGVGLQVLALSVDALDDGRGGGAVDDDQAGNGADGVAAARRTLAKLDFPFDSGVATVELAGKFQTLSDALFTHRRRLPVPTSILIDAEGRVAAMYKGPVAVDQLIEDVARLEGEATPEQLVEWSMPLTGRRYSSPSNLTLADVALHFIEAGHLDDAVAYLAAHRAEVADGRSRPDGVTDANAHYSLAVGLARQGQPDEAAREYREAIRLRPEFLDAYFNLGELLTKQGRPDEAMAQYRKALKVDKSYAKAHNNLAILLAERGKVEQAIKHYRQALESSPQDVDVLNNLGNALVRTGHADEAIELFDRALELAPEDARTFYNKGAALDAKKHYEAAAEAYAEAVRLDPSHVLAHNNLGVDYARLGRLAEAEELVRRATELDPEYQPARNNLKLIRSLRERAAAGGAGDDEEDVPAGG